VGLAGRAVAAIAHRFGPAEYAFVTDLPPEECLARLEALVPARTRWALFP
jgi:hypothetical protein